MWVCSCSLTGTAILVAFEIQLGPENNGFVLLAKSGSEPWLFARARTRLYHERAGRRGFGRDSTQIHLMNRVPS
jgi:hypothetical protein